MWAGVVCACECVVGGRMWHPVSKLACDGEGTLRFQGYLFSSIPKEFHCILNLIFVFVLFFNSYLLLYGKKKILFFFLQIELSYVSFSIVFFFLRKQIYAFFFFLSPFCSVKQSLADETDGAHFEPELLRGAAKVVEHDVHKWHLFHLWRVDLKYCLFIALFQLSKRRGTAGRTS